MYYFITASKDTYITENSPGYVVQYPNSKNKNYGGDEILELKKDFLNEFSTSSYCVSRIITEFNYDGLVSDFEVSGGLIPSESVKYYLRYYEVEGQKELQKTYSLSSHLVHQTLNWDVGTGKHFDNPKTTDGVTWTDYKSGSAWSSTESGMTSGSRTTGGGVWLTSVPQPSQSFQNESGDINLDITDIVNRHLEGTANRGILIKFSGSYEDDGTPLNLKFFSRNTHTIYQPKLEVRWNDCNYTLPTGYNYITMSGELENHIFIRGLQSKYRESERVRFRIGCRKKYTTRTFTESMLTSSFYIPKGSGSYSIVDSATNEDIVPFGAYTSMSADTTSMYFDQWMNGFEPGRYYKILFKLKYDDGQEVIIDNSDEFKVI
tara:strand:+ start:79 stop:1206 length:1128 start_codon:yes stop_codon:yes gene_type:complete